MTYCQELNCFQFEHNCKHDQKLAKLKKIRGEKDVQVYIAWQDDQVVYPLRNCLTYSPTAPVPSGSVAVYHEKYNQIIVVGKMCQAYTISSRAWRVLPPMKLPRLYATLIAYEDYLYAFGGWFSSKYGLHLNFNPWCEKLPLSQKSSKWMDIAPLKMLQNIRTAILKDGKIYVSGKVYYDPQMNTWTYLE